MIFKFFNSNKLLLFSTVFVISLFLTSRAVAQNEWVEYVAVKDEGVMSVALDLKYDLYKPNYKNLLVVGAQFKKCLKNGFPTEEGLDDIYAFSDSTLVAIDKISPNILVGYITYQCMGFDIFYVKDTTGLRSELSQMIKKDFGTTKTYIEIRKDKAWDYYKNYIYPRDFSSEFLVDQNYLNDLVLQGDNLQGLRKVNHWIYFKSVNKRNLFGKKAKELEFSLDSIAYKKNRAYPYELVLSRQDSINPQSVYRLTTMLRVLSQAMSGQYDGWSTEVKNSN